MTRIQRRRAMTTVRHWTVAVLMSWLGGCDKQPTTPEIIEPVVIAFAGRNGAPLESVGNWEIYTIREDGTGLTNLTQSPENDFFPSWSPDHRFIAFYSMRAPAGVWIMDSDGSNRRLLAASTYQGAVAWAPDGSKLAVSVVDDSGGRVLIMRPDGTDRRTLMAGAMNALEWSPDGRTILYARHIDGGLHHIFAVSIEGGTTRDLTEWGRPGLWYASDPAYSPDGSVIAFMRADLDRGLWLMKPDGSNPNQITLGEDRRPTWLRANRILVERMIGQRWTLYIISSDGAIETELVTGLEHSFQPSR